VNPSDNFDLSKHLGNPSRGVPQEAAYRGAVGRAYYGAFILARDALLDAGVVVPNTGKAHAIVAEELKKSSDDDVAAAGGSLEDLRTLRNQADYDLGARPHKGNPFDSMRAAFS
jgi:hypothetical protein